MYICGDFNINQLGINVNVSECFEPICCKDIFSTRTLPTRIHLLAISLIDSILFNSIDKKTDSICLCYFLMICQIIKGYLHFVKIKLILKR